MAKDRASESEPYCVRNAAYFIGRILSLLFCAMICCMPLISSLGCRPKKTLKSRAILHESENGAAALTYSVDPKKDFSFSANLDLPEVRGNQSWYCVWILLGELKNTSQRPSMLQVGLMRWDQSQFRVRPFITTEASGHDLNFRPLANNLSGSHRFAIAGDSSKIELRMDDKTLISVARAEFFKDDSPIYLKIAAEVFAVGDMVSGLVDHVALVSNGVRRDPPISYAAFKDRGLKFLCKGKGQWEATGQFDPKLRFVQYVPSVCR
ncbi:MAG: hypothetical protein ACREQR_11995 [Candidatus Binataceae bacterium]